MLSTRSIVVAATLLSVAATLSAQQTMSPPAAAPPGGGRAPVVVVDPAAPKMSTGEARLVGRVVDAAGETPVPGAVVTLTFSGAQPVTVTTGADGGFSFLNLPAGHFGLVATRDGYLPGGFGRRRPFGPLQSLDLVERERRTDVLIRVWRQATVSGQVVDESNQPVRGANVRAIARSNTGGGLRWELGPASATDERGFYRIPSLTPGDYMLAVPRAASRAAYETVFYVAAPAPSSALVLPMRSGDERTGLDFQLQPAPAGVHLSGVMTGAGGAGIAGMSIALTRADLVDLALPIDRVTATTDAQGRFQFDRVLPGDYVARALSFVTAADRAARDVVLTATDRMLPLVGEPVRWAETTVTVADKDVSDVAMSLRSGLTVSGIVRFEGGGVAGDVTSLNVFLTRADGRPSELPSRGTVSASGRFTTAGLLPGKYFVRVAGQLPSWTVKSAMLDGRDVSDVPLELDADDVSGVVITYTNRPTQLSGTVLDAKGVPDPRASVIVFPADSQLWATAGTSRRFYRLRVTPTAQYTAKNLPAGSYFVAAVPEEASAGWTDAAFLDALSRMARRVTITDGASLTQELRTLTVR